MAAFCLVKDKADEFKKALVSGEINPAKLSDMSSDQRRDFLEKYVGKENSQDVNALFESKLLLKNQKAGYISWAKRVGGLTIQARRDLLSRIERMDKVLDPKEETGFLKDLAEQRLGIGVTEEEAKTIFDLSQKVQEAAKNKEQDRMSWGRAQVKLLNYLAEAKARGGKLTLNPLKIAKELPGITKSINASMDDSAIFRQGWKTLWTNPVIWSKNAARSFSDLVKEFGTQKVMDEIRADILSRPNYDRYVKAKLAVSTREEAYPSTLPEKIPLVGRAYKATETAFTGFVYRQRADIFDKYMDIAKKYGLDTDNPETIKPIGSMVNSLTGRGNLGPAEPAANVFNNVFFSPRYVKSEIDTLAHALTGAGGSNFVRKQASINLLKVLIGTSAVLGIANLVKPGSVQTDPRSSDFGKIKIGDTRFDVTGGMGSLAVLASRLITQSSKSSTTGAVTKLNSGAFGAQTGEDVFKNFLENKLSPTASVIKDILNGKDFNGKPITLQGELGSLVTPLTVKTYNELKSDPNSAPTLLAMIADGLGIATNTYTVQPKTWSDSQSKQITGFKNTVSSDEFKKTNDEYNKQVQDTIRRLQTTSSYQNMDSDQQQAFLTRLKTTIEKQVLKDHGYEYKQDRSSSSSSKELLDQVVNP